INGSPTVGILLGSGTPTVLIGYGTLIDTGRACDGGVAAYRGSDGQLLWNFSQRNFDAVTPEGQESLYGVVSAPAIADVDGDGKLEIAFGGLDRNLYMLNSDGSVRWYYHAADTVWSTPLFMNIDADPQLELIAGTDISENTNPKINTPNGGFVYAFDTQQRTPANLPRIAFQTGYIWRTTFDQVIYSSPAAADLLSSNTGNEIAVGSGCFFPDPGSDKRGKWVKILRPSDGVVLQTLNAPACVQSSPAIGDIDGDGLPEIVATVSGAASIGGDGKSDIVAWDPTNPAPKWSTSTGDPNSGTNDAFGGDLQSPVIADLDGNGSLEVIAANFWSVHVLRGDTGAPLTCQSPSCGTQTSLFTWGTLKSTPAVGDINNDGKLDLVIGGMNALNPDHGQLYAWTNFAGTLGSPAGSQSPYSAPWPQFHHDARSSGTTGTPAILLTTTSADAIITPTAHRSFTIPVGSGDGSQISWEAKVLSDPSQIITITSGSGTNGQSVVFDIAGSNLTNGSYTGTIQITSAGLPPVEISVSLLVSGSVSTVFLPAVIR
ncbi:MAG: FG-GAP-like repeat-containing protein, partial [Chloroflexales bacterium]